MKISEKEVKKLRNVYRLNQTEFGTLAGVSGALICQIESGKRTLTERVSAAIVDKLDLTAESLGRIIGVYDEFNVT